MHLHERSSLPGLRVTHKDPHAKSKPTRTRFSTVRFDLLYLLQRIYTRLLYLENDLEPARAQEHRDERSLLVYNRVQHKLTGRDFDIRKELSVSDQVEKLIQQATSLENLCQCFSGWCVYILFRTHYSMLIKSVPGVRFGRRGFF
jgi:hypothetical protein